jgi:hypothetical protein
LRGWQNVGIKEHFTSYTLNNEIHSEVGRSRILEVLYFENVSITVWNRICKMAFFYNLFCMGVSRGLRVERNVIVLRGTCSNKGEVTVLLNQDRRELQTAGSVVTIIVHIPGGFHGLDIQIGW